MRRAAFVVALRPDGLVLAVSRPDPPLRFGFPGGGVEPGETFEQGAQRELLEETGYHAPTLRPLYQRRTQNGTHVVAFYAPSVIGTLRSSDEGIAVWLPPGVHVDPRTGAFPEDAIAIFGAAR